MCIVYINKIVQQTVKPRITGPHEERKMAR